MSNSIEQVRLTADDAIISKMACVDLGYYKDNYIHNFIRRRAKRTPIINRGYYSRVVAIENFVSRFIKKYDRRCQIISLGGGYDTLLFRLHDLGLQPEMFIDFDLKETCRNKAAILVNCDQLKSVIFEDEPVDIHSISSTIHTKRYILQPMDLTDINGMKDFFNQNLIDASLPTLILSECVLIYINPDAVNPTLKYLQQSLPNSSFVVYEQIRPNDPFGSMMVKNLHERGCDLLGLATYPDPDAQKRRYLDLGYTNVFCEDMYIIYSKYLDPVDVKRISRIELFDEFEEWFLIQSHYCITVCCQGCFNEWFNEFIQ